MNPTLLYALAGIIGSFCRAAVTLTHPTWTRQTLVDVLLGGAIGLVLPLFPNLLPLPTVATEIQRAGFIVLLTYTVGDLIPNLLGQAKVAKAYLGRRR